MADFNVRSYGAVGDGTTNDRAAIQKAVDLCSSSGGGRVVIPSGKFLSGTIVLRSDVELHLEQGALLISSLDEKDIIDAGWVGGCFLYALHEKNVAITGRGTIYGQGDRVFFDDDADGGFHECPKNFPAFRPRTTYFEDIDNLTVQGITFKEAAFWTLHLAGCRRVLVEGVRILNDPRGANNDGIDPDSCKDVVIRNCIIETGDDAIVIKNSQAMAVKYGACENIIVSSCILHSHDSAIKIGTETFDAIRNIIVSDCVFKDCSRGIGIWARDGAVVEDIHVHHIPGNTLRYADCPQRKNAPRWWGKGEPIFIDATYRDAKRRHPGSIRNISFDHIYLKSESCIFIAGEEDARVTNIELECVRLIQARQGSQPVNLFDEQPSERNVYRHDIPVVYARCVDGLRIKDGSCAREAPGIETWSADCIQTENCSDVEIDMTVVAVPARAEARP
jgi:hypothetical protein